MMVTDIFVIFVLWKAINNSFMFGREIIRAESIHCAFFMLKIRMDFYVR